MMKKQLMKQLEQWRAKEQYAQIVSAIEAIEPEVRSYALVLEWVRAMAHLGDHDGAIAELVRLSEEGRHDPAWHFLLGESYLALEQYDLAMRAFEETLLLDQTDEQAWHLLDSCCAQLELESPLYERFDHEYFRAPQPVRYSEEELAAVRRHIAQYFGVASIERHEMASEVIGVDILIIQPTFQRPFYTLITVGMGAWPMYVPEPLRASKLERAELLICLPLDWQINSYDEKWHWPISWLKTLAALPSREGGWLAWGHTVPGDGPIAEGTELMAVILSGPCAQPHEAGICALADGSEVNFYQVIPLYEEELRFKMERGAEALFNRFEGVDHVVDIHRANTCAVLINKQWAISAEGMKPLLDDWQGPDGALATDRIVVDGLPVGYMYREAPEDDDTDSGWRFLAGDESEAYIADHDHFGIYQLNTLCNYDPDILPLLYAPYGTAYYRNEHGVFRQEIRRPPTFAARVQGFWQWFVQHETELAAAIDGNLMEELQQQMAEGLALIADDFSWRLKAVREINFPAEMRTWRFFLLPYLVAQAPAELCSRWKFWAGQPQAKSGEMTVAIGDRVFDLADVLAMIGEEESTELLSLQLYHPAWQDMAETEIYEVIYVLLEQAIGELLDYLYINDVLMLNEPCAEMFPLMALEEQLTMYLAQQEQTIERQAERLWRSYERIPEDRETMRYDIYWGESCYMELISSYYSGDVAQAEALAAHGAQAVYLFFAHGGLLITEAQQALLLDIQHKLAGIMTGRGLLLGYGLGESCGYIDLLLYDMPAFLEEVEAVLAEYPYSFYMAELKPKGRVAQLF